MRKVPPAVLQHLQVRVDGDGTPDPEMPGAGQEVTPVDLVIGAVLLDDEHVHAQAEDAVQLRGGDLVTGDGQRERRGLDDRGVGGHAHLLAHRT